MQKLIKLCIAIGGFLIVSGLILTGIVFLILSNIIDMNVLTDQVAVALLTLIFMTIGVVSIIAGTTLFLKR